MKLRYSALLVIALCAFARPASATSFSYDWSATLDHCNDPGGFYCDWWGGLGVSGSFTYDDASQTYTNFTSVIPSGNFTWRGPLLPDQDASDIFENSYIADALGGIFQVVINAPDVERQIIGLYFSKPADGAGAFGVHGFVERRFAGPRLFFTFEDGGARLTSPLTASPVPEPTTLLLLAAPIGAMVRRLHTQRARAARY